VISYAISHPGIILQKTITGTNQGLTKPQNIQIPVQESIGLLWAAVTGRIKANVDLAGLSLRQVPLKVLISFLLETLYLYH